ncbi:MAG: C4-dicarboxylate ABC transporter [Betaproteobacteria bacterium]|nr:MAG: C4-dicarboxylate ABC transporter [Betaproteobacteria bacterium]
MRSGKRIFAFLGATILVLSSFVGEVAAQQMKLRVADSLAVGSYIAEQGAKYWMREVTRLTNGAVEFEHYPAEQLGKAKDLLALTQSGVVDIGYVVPAYASDKMPLSAVVELPGNFQNSCTGTLAYWKLVKGDGILAKREFEPNGIRVLIAFAASPYQLFAARRKIDGIKTIEGMKLRTAGGASDATVRTFKGVPVRIAVPELHESLSRGTIDGIFFPYASIISNKLTELLKYGTEGENFGSGLITYSISEARWQKLPQNVQKAMNEASEAATRNLCGFTDKQMEIDKEKIRQQGVVLAPLPQSERKEIDANFSVVAGEWAEILDKRGKPGSEVLKAYRAALQELR